MLPCKRRRLLPYPEEALLFSHVAPCGIGGAHLQSRPASIKNADTEFAEHASANVLFCVSTQRYVCAYEVQKSKEKANRLARSMDAHKRAKTFHRKVLDFCEQNKDVFHFIVKMFRGPRALTLSFPVVFLYAPKVEIKIEFNDLAPENEIKLNLLLQCVEKGMPSLEEVLLPPSALMLSIVKGLLPIRTINERVLGEDEVALFQFPDVPNVKPMHQRNGRLTIAGAYTKLAEMERGRISPTTAQRIVELFCKLLAGRVGKRGFASVLGMFVIKYNRHIDAANQGGHVYQPRERRVAIPNARGIDVKPKDPHFHIVRILLVCCVCICFLMVPHCLFIQNVCT